jgi:uncharacterized protein YPO0396
MAENELHRDIGRLEGRISALEHQLSEHRTGMTMALADMRNDMKAAMAELKVSVDEIKAHIQSDNLTDAQRLGAVKGAWWVIGLVSASLITIGGLVASILRAVLK